ncbi:MAG: AIM24 family protein [Candidatus Methanomethylophilaceae archaeon]
MRYVISGDNLQMANITLSEGEAVEVIADSVAYTVGKFDIKASKGFISGLKRAITGEGLETVTYSPSKGVAALGVGGTLPGRIMDVELNRTDWIAQKDSFLAMQPTITVKIEFQKKLGDAFGNESFTLLRLGGKGMAFLFALGDFIIFPLDKGDSYEVSTDRAVAWESTVKYKIEPKKEMKSGFFDKDLPYVTKFEGPGRIVMQTMSLLRVHSMLSPYIEAEDSK